MARDTPNLAVNNQLVEAANPDPRVPDDAVMQVVGRVDDMNPLKVETVKFGLRDGDIEKLRATVLPSRPFGGEICDLVNITQVRVGPEESTFSLSGVINSRPLLTTQQIFWFARSNGRLVRFQVPGAGGGAIPRIDAQITLQKFNPTLGAKDFAFTLPKGAVQEND